MFLLSPNSYFLASIYEDSDLAVRLIEDSGVEALVNVSFKSVGGEYATSAYPYGLPVRRKKISPVDDHSHDPP